MLAFGVYTISRLLVPAVDIPTCPILLPVDTLANSTNNSLVSLPLSIAAISKDSYTLFVVSFTVT